MHTVEPFASPHDRLTALRPRPLKSAARWRSLARNWGARLIRPAALSVSLHSLDLPADLPVWIVLRVQVDVRPPRLDCANELRGDPRHGVHSGLAWPTQRHKIGRAHV